MPNQCGNTKKHLSQDVRRISKAPFTIKTLPGAGETNHPVTEPQQCHGFVIIVASTPRRSLFRILLRKIPGFEVSCGTMRAAIIKIKMSKFAHFDDVGHPDIVKWNGIKGRESIRWEENLSRSKLVH